MLARSAGTNITPMEEKRILPVSPEAAMSSVTEIPLTLSVSQSQVPPSASESD